MADIVLYATIITSSLVSIAVAIRHSRCTTIGLHACCCDLDIERDVMRGDSSDDQPYQEDASADIDLEVGEPGGFHRAG